MTKVKICGITNLEDAQLSAKFGADALGFNFYPKSPRYILPMDARKIIDELPEDVLNVGVFVNEDLEKIVKIVQTANLDTIQLHGEETPEFAKELKEKIGLKIIKAFRVSSEFKPEDVLQYKVDAILLDAYSAKEHGGTGETFDWEIARKVKEIFPKIYLAGGLSEKNVSEAILFNEPFFVDTCSKLEKSKGLKDKNKVKKFIENSNLIFPKAFAWNGSDSNFLVRQKKKAIKNFSWKSSSSLNEVSRLAYWLYVFEEPDKSLEVCEYLSKFQFAGNFNLYTWIEHSLALQARIYRSKSKLDAAKHCINRITEAGFAKTRLEGLFVFDSEDRLLKAIKENDSWAIRENRLSLMIELCILIELGGSKKLSVSILEKMFATNLKNLKQFMEV